MLVAPRPYVMAGVVLAAANLVAVTPPVSRAAQLPIRNIETRLVDVGDSLFNIPFNLFQEIVNIPSSEIDAVTYAAQSLFNSGPWFVVSNTNLWDGSTDPSGPRLHNFRQHPG